jgi:hypothetical protein
MLFQTREIATQVKLLGSECIEPHCKTVAYLDAVSKTDEFTVTHSQLRRQALRL